MSRRSKKKVKPEKAAAVRLSTPVSQPDEMPGATDSRSPKSKGCPAGSNDRWLVPGVCIFLAAIIWVVFGQTLHHEFVNFDDDAYVYENPEVARGLTLQGIAWAFSHVHSTNWHPLTWISHMLDCQFYGLSPGGHHLTSILLHTVVAILLFLILRQMTGALWRSAFIAAVFAIHPLRVESVAWISERKDVLSGLFLMFTLWAYARYVEKSTVQSSKSKVFYGLTLLFFSLGLMCKPMLVTLPFVLLLLDYWPLKRISDLRFAISDLKHLLLEKIPFFILAAASCVITIFAQHEALQSFETVPLPLRMENAAVSCVAYLGQMFWPSGLALFYPFTPGSIGVSEVVLSLVLLAGISAGVFVLRRRHPCFLTGWLWYLIMLAPVIGIIQAGSQTRADRYTYLPQIGLYLLLAWAAADLCAGWRHRRVLLGGGSAAILAALIFCARAQTSYWRNSESLWTHTLACTSDNTVAHNNLGNALLQKGNVAEAIAHFKQALQIKPNYAKAHFNFGNALLETGNVDEAIAHFQKALEIKPDYAEAHNNLGNALFQKGNVGEAITHFQRALRIKPDDADPHNNLGNALLQNGNVDEAIAHFQRALQIKPGYAEAHYNLGNALLQKGNMGEAIAHYQQALQIRPDYAKALNNLAWVLAANSQASLRNGNKAVDLAQRANQLAGNGNPAFLDTLAIAYAEAGRFSEAVETAKRALQLAEAQSNTTLADAIRSQLKLYQAGIPFHLH